MSTVAVRNTMPTAEVIQRVLIEGDLSGLSAEQKTNYYMKVCESVGLNHLTRPFDYIRLNGKLVLYAKKDATDQLRNIHNVSVYEMKEKTVNDVHIVTAYAENKEGRKDVSTGAVNIAGLKGDALANALMKAETKAKRRVTLSICGLGMLDETEVETIHHEEAPNGSTKNGTVSDEKSNSEDVATNALLNSLSEDSEVEAPPVCSRCGKLLRVSKSGEFWACINWKDESKGKHDLIKIIQAGK